MYWPSGSKVLEFPKESSEKHLKVFLESEKDIGNKIVERKFILESNMNSSGAWDKRTLRQLQVKIINIFLP